MLREYKKVNAALAADRDAAALNSDDFAVWWAGGRAALEKRKFLENLFFSDADFDDPKHVSHMSHAEYFEHQVKKGAKFLIKFRKWFEKELGPKFDPAKPADLESIYDWNSTKIHLEQALFAQKSPFSLHYGMFLVTLLSNASDEQLIKWLPKAWEMNGWIGTYAQTELGHGSFIRGLETRVEYDVRKQQFILNTPKLTSYKWWPGSLGNIANVAVIIAPLYINGKPCGLQQFLVRLRDKNTHELLPGVDIGELGPKMGVNGANNGFLGLKNVRIPRTNMLMKHAKVFPSGKFVPSPQPLLLYNTMMFIRVGLVRDVAFNLLVASTIATR